MHPAGGQRTTMTLLRRPLGLPRNLRFGTAAVAILVVLYLISPYVALWRLNRTIVNGPTAALAPLVDIESVRDQVQRRLNKEEESRIGEVSDAFIDWIQHNIRHYHSDPVARAIDLKWLRELLLRHSEGDAGFWPALEYAFYASPTSFKVRIGNDVSPGEPPGNQPPPVQLRLERGLLRWRVSTAYY